MLKYDVTAFEYTAPRDRKCPSECRFSLCTDGIACMFVLFRLFIALL